MVKKSRRGKWKRAEVKDVEAALDDKRLLSKSKENVSDLFAIDTKGSSAGLPRSVRKTLAKEKKVKNGHALSALELEKIARTSERVARRRLGQTAETAEGKLQNFKKNKAPSDTARVADLWGGESSTARGTTTCAGSSDASTNAGPSSLSDKSSSSPSEESGKKEKCGNKLYPNFDKDAFLLGKHSIQKMNKAIYRPQSAPKTLGQRTSKAPAVVLPRSSGQSINPDEAAKEDAEAEVVATEYLRQQESQDLSRKMNPMRSRLQDCFSTEELDQMDEATKVKEYQRLVRLEMNPELPSSEEEDSTNAGGDQAPMKKKPSVRLTKAQKNKRKRHSEDLKEASEKKRQKLLDKSIGAVPALLKEMEKELECKKNSNDYKDSLKREKIELERQGVVLKGKKMGRERFSEGKFVEDLLPNEGSGNLRSTKVVSAVMDRVKSIYRRNLATQPAEVSRATLDRVRKKAKRVERGTKNRSMNRSLLLA